MFGKDGLISQIVSYAISNSLIKVVLVFIDIKYIFKQLAMKFRCIRQKSIKCYNLVVEYLARSEIVEDNQQHVASVNEFMEGTDINIT